MSEMQLTDELVQSVQAALTQHDERARDLGITVQYLAATMGYILGRQNIDTPDKHDLLEKLTAFAREVMEDVDGGQPEEQAPAPEAFGIWRAPRE
ncbi:MAG TPA: hypothetical protein VKA14_05530 [Gammaproteobacteria bacterium]|nr:hypothetical protein [Gammaproteobacteria bacterium]